MAKKLRFLVFIIIAFVFVYCSREPVHTNPKVKALSDYESNDGEISLNIKGGKAPYVIEWSNNLSDSVLSNLMAGTYFVTITDARKKTFVDTIVVTQPPWPICFDIEGNSYKTAVFGGQTWMIENLRVKKNPMGAPVENFGVNDSLVTIYGRLYTWQIAMNNSVNESAQGICPDGWHLPSDEDWSTLIDNISNFDQEIPNLEKSLELTYPGFFNNDFYNLDASVSFWTSTQASDNAWKRYFNKNLSKAFRYHENKQNAISVRCVKNK
ncbi:MAG: hypothetical protein JEZ09_11765 [Salinivirgaceae bacterium]|nr:hypothetical protein [Salinivirgaceae bacterium]